MFFFFRPENKPFLSAACAVALVTVIVLNLHTRRNHISNTLLIIGVLMVYIFRAANGSVILPYISADVNK